MLSDAMSVQQSILLEVWDADLVTSDFLGEAWLPPLEMLTSQKKDFVLPLMPADFSDAAERGPSRNTWKGKKISVDDQANEKSENRIIKGNLMVQLQWIYPKFELNEKGEVVPR